MPKLAAAGVVAALAARVRLVALLLVQRGAQAVITTPTYLRLTAVRRLAALAAQARMARVAAVVGA